MIGIKLSLETKQKMSEAAKGYVKSLKHCQNLSKALTGIKRSEETKAKLRLYVGSNTSMAKLNEEQVIKIKILLKERNLTHMEIADMFNVKRGTIRAIQYGQSWKHIQI